MCPSPHGQPCANTATAAIYVHSRPMLVDSLTDTHASFLLWTPSWSACRVGRGCLSQRSAPFLSHPSPGGCAVPGLCMSRPPSSGHKTSSAVTPHSFCIYPTRRQFHLGVAVWFHAAAAVVFDDRTDILVAGWAPRTTSIERNCCVRTINKVTFHESVFQSPRMGVSLLLRTIGRTTRHCPHKRDGSSASVAELYTPVP